MCALSIEYRFSRSEPEMHMKRVDLLHESVFAPDVYFARTVLLWALRHKYSPYDLRENWWSWLKNIWSERRFRRTWRPSPPIKYPRHATCPSQERISSVGIRILNRRYYPITIAWQRKGVLEITGMHGFWLQVSPGISHLLICQVKKLFDKIKSICRWMLRLSSSKANSNSQRN